MADDLDLSLYDALVEQHALPGYVRLLNFGEMTAGRKWNCDMVRPAVSFEGLGDFAFDLLGTVNTEDGMFLWSWANPGASQWSPAVVSAAKGFAERGQREAGLAVFTEAKVSDQWVPPLELGTVCSELSGGKPLYLAQSGKTLVVMLVHTAQPVAASAPVVSLPRVLLDFQQITMASPQNCVEGYLQSTGYTVSDTQDGTQAVDRVGNVVQIQWDEQGRIADIRMNLKAAT